MVEVCERVGDEYYQLLQSMKKVDARSFTENTRTKQTKREFGVQISTLVAQCGEITDG